RAGHVLLLVHAPPNHAGLRHRTVTPFTPPIPPATGDGEPSPVAVNEDHAAVARHMVATVSCPLTGAPGDGIGAVTYNPRRRRRAPYRPPVRRVTQKWRGGRRRYGATVRTDR